MEGFGPPFLFAAENFAEEPPHGVEETVGNALFQGNYGVVRDVNLLRADLRAAFGDVAPADPGGVLHKFRAVGAVVGVHLQPGQPDKKAGAGKFGFLFVLPQNVANVLAQKALNALAEFLHPVHVVLKNLGLFHDGCIGGNFFIYLEIPGYVADQIPD